MTSLSDAHTTAARHWAASGSRTSGAVMAMRAKEGVEWFLKDGVTACEDITVGHATRYLTYLRQVGYSADSVVSYYGTFKRMVELSLGKGYCDRWPKPPPKPRRSPREPLTGEDLDRLIEHFRRAGYQETADLACVLRGAGLRVDIEALAPDALAYADDAGAPYGTLTVTGKGGHERTVPVVDPCARQVLGDPERLTAMRRIPYRTHLDRWNKAVKACEVVSKLATPHAVRHAYVTEAHRRSGGDLALAQELAGHASPATTARYIHHSLDRKAAAL